MSGGQRFYVYLSILFNIFLKYGYVPSEFCGSSRNWRGGCAVGAVAVSVASRPEACRLSQLQGCGFESAPLTSIA